MHWSKVEISTPHDAEQMKENNWLNILGTLIWLQLHAENGVTQNKVM